MVKAKELAFYGDWLSAPEALALGLVVWFVFWAALTLAGFIVMRTGGARLRDLTRRVQDGSPS